MTQLTRRAQICAIGTTRNEVDLIRANLCYHLNQGIDRFLLLDHDSTDGTRDVLRTLAATGKVDWSPYTGPFRQDLLLTQLTQTAVARGADWIIPIDADEFWHAREGTLRQALERSRAGALRVQLVNYIQQRAQRHTTPGTLLTMTRRVAVPVGPMERVRELVEAEQISYVEQLHHYKWIVRASPSLEIGWGNHVVHGTLRPIEDSAEIVCLHAPLRSFAALRAKISIGPDAELVDYFNIAWHLRRWRRMVWEDRLEDEWRANSYLNDTLDVHGRQHRVVFDDTLRRLVGPWLNPNPHVPASPLDAC